jgi:hypothetical protein
MEPVRQRLRGRKAMTGIWKILGEGALMENNFSQLNIDGAIIRELRLVPSQKLVMTLLLGPQKQDKRAIQVEYDLQFNFVKDFRIDLQSEPWLQLVSHAVSRESQYLRDFNTTASMDSLKENLAHYEIICAQGRLDIIARDFVFSQFNEIPYVETSE